MNGTTACKWDSVIPFEPMWEQLKRIIKPKGAIVLFGSQPFTSALVMSNAEWFRCEWIWEKDNASNPALAKMNPMKYHENVMIFSDSQPTYNYQMWNAGKFTNKRGKAPRNLANGREKVHTQQQQFSNYRYPKSVQRFNRPKANTGLVHPTQKPVALIEYLIKTYTNEGETVLDFTFGSGTAAVACVNTNRRFIGIEQDSGYFEIAQKRIAEAIATPKQLELV